MPYANSGSGGRGKPSRPSEFWPGSRTYVEVTVQAPSSPELYAGAEYGERVRKELGIDEFEKTHPKDVILHIIFTADTYTVTHSFLRGLLRDSVEEYPTVDLFFNRYKFTAPRRINELIENFIALDCAHVRSNYC